MSIIESPTAPAPAKRKPAKRRKRAAAVAAPKPAASYLAGLTITECTTACYAAAAAGKPGCVISGKFYCAHPAKGGLQGVDISNDAAVARVEAAKKMLGKATIKIGKL